ncbi:phage tail tape measure protein [Clostridium sporogenes]|uniref:phage tail tape measure protein n=1 Tax=Clostridium sporogenes TaxID=1509 RepID=UPI000717A258|nr:phage tail tape measure protein [Clostridium sporogenes]KRU42196.1 phage tail tape measure protein [Clostridium sporogenes]MBY7066276.1 phage tail tape measure protein [Clostridium sporogenes]MBY7069203.1 phage tail tape measure protein [Clostridium sporogenes]MCW6065759.1 phage tail tape measure protein [Clostridium sporogenes]NFQ01702.1 phage tail tape measure protein [Clostridium sporogenes]
MASNTEKRITAKMVLDSTGYNDKLKGLNAEMKKHQAELKLASQGIKSFGKDSERLKSVQESLSKQVELHSKKVDMYKKSIEKANTKMKDNIKTRDKIKDSLDKANRKYEEAVKIYGKESTEAKKAKDEVNKLSEEHKKAEKAVETNAKQVQNYETNMNKANAEMTKAKGNLNKVNDELSKSNNKWLNASDKLKDHSEKLKKTGSEVSGVGDKILKLSAPIAAAGIASAKLGTDFNEAMSTVSTLIPGQQKRLQDLKGSVQDVAIATGKGTDDIANGTYQVISAFGDASDTMEKVEINAKSATAGMATTTDALNLSSAVMKGYGDTTAKANEKVMDMSFMTVKLGQTDFPSLASSIGKVVPLSNELKVSQEEMFSVFATGTGVTGTASEVSTQYRGILQSLMAPTKDMTSLIEEMGFKDGKAMMEKKGLAGTIELITKKAKETNTPLQKYIGSIEGQTLALALAGEQSGVYKDKLEQMKHSQGAMNEAFKEQTEGINKTGFAYKQAMVKMQVAGQKMGDAMAPILEKGAELFTKLADKLGSLSKEQLESIAKWGMFSIATGGALKVVGGGISTIGNIAGGLSKLTGWLGKTSIATKGAESAVKGASVATNLASKGITGMGLATKVGTIALNPWVLGIGAATVAGVALYKHLKKDATPQVDLFADKVSKSNTAMMNYSAASKGVEISNVKISKSTKQAVGAYMDLDKKASKSMLNLVANSNKFSKQAKDKVLKNFTDMSKKSSKLSNEQKNAITTNFKKLVADTGVLTKKNKNEIIKQYTAMVNGTKGLSKKQKEQTIREFTDTLNKSIAITKQQSDNLQKIYKDMGDKIKIGLDKKKAEELQSQQDFFSKSNVLTTTEEAKILQTTTTSWENKKKTIDGLQNQINSIIKNAADNHRQITTEEAKTIDGLQKKMKENAVKTLSASEVEQKVIIERLKSYNGRITAEQASEVIKNAEKQRQGTVDKANKQYDGTVRNIIKLRDESKVISAATADKMIKEAERQRKETINKANDQKKQVVSKVKGMNSDIGKSVNTTTGDILSKWDKLKSWWTNWHPDAKQFNYTLRGIETKGVQKKWTGDRYFSGGLTYLHDAPGQNSNYELYDLPRGTRIFNHDASADLVMKTAENVATKVANSVLSGFKGTNGVNVTQHIYAPVPTPSEMARQSKNNLRELALNW